MGDLPVPNRSDAHNGVRCSPGVRRSASVDDVQIGQAAAYGVGNQAQLALRLWEQQVDLVGEVISLTKEATQPADRRVVLDFGNDLRSGHRSVEMYRTFLDHRLHRRATAWTALLVATP